MILGFFILFAIYFYSMVFIVLGYRNVRFFSSSEMADKPKEIRPATRFSVVIPFRNEAENLPNLLKTIHGLKYPSEMFELIFVNDASEDISEAIISEAMEKSRFSIKLIQNERISNSPKKDAISKAIKNSDYEWIVTTDADCELPKNLLKTLDGFIQKSNPVMVCGPVIYKSNGSFIENFQQLDGLSLQAVTIGSFGLNNPLLCNGANLAYKKEAFLKVNGFSGNDHLASGDDIFLFEKLKKAFPKRVRFLKSEEAIVFTKPQQTWKTVINQRIRWASKTTKQNNPVSMFLGILVFLVNLSVLAFPFFMIFDTGNLGFYLLLIAIKIIVDYVVIQQTASLFGNKLFFWKFLLQTYMYALIVLIVTLGSFRGNYSWKGRTFEKQ
ncbi:glycosyltransferase [Aequorivita todarodis]|uniref:glycosyltransferase family 2 protein n=1 Tax=Aequorivita todarodis TaxID=2036821 RepID=UPI00234FEEAC|nr:glycosyltransferase [Aequorivita todarodis]MDC8001727.1 glycosyltransferase [Aequorivita todarodis]